MLCVADGTQAHYYLPAGYKYRDSVDLFDDRTNKARWQDHVYQKAHKLFMANQCHTVLDIGCGGGFKLLKYFSGFDTTGIDVKQTVDDLCAAHPDRKWRVAQEDATRFLPADLYICSDVIEHVRHPDKFFEKIVASPFRYLVMSTPAREVLFADGKREWLGPPENEFHHFEWTMGEFHKFASRYVDILEHSYLYNGEYTQVLLARQKG
jgi:SAM-dependent methyltransferase